MALIKAGVATDQIERWSSFYQLLWFNTVNICWLNNPSKVDFCWHFCKERVNQRWPFTGEDICEPLFWSVSWIIPAAMAGVYHQRHPERTVFYRVLFHYFDEFVAEYENRFEREYGYFRPVIQEVVEKYLDCGNPKCGFARIRCRDCGSEFLLHFSWFSLWPGRSPADFRRFVSSPLLLKRFGPPWATSDCPWHLFYRDLYFPTMVEWENDDKDAHPSSPAEKEILIFKYICLLNTSILILIKAGLEYINHIFKHWHSNLRSWNIFFHRFQWDF